MSMEESKERLKNSRIEPDYFWWHGKDFLPILKRMLEEVEGIGAEDAIIEGHLGLDKSGSPDIHLRVVNARTKDCGDCFNFSHVCPPDCG